MFRGLGMLIREWTGLYHVTYLMMHVMLPLLQWYQSFVFLCYAGVFTATMAGTYVFHMHVRSEGRDSGSIYMVKDKKRICSTWIDDVKGLWDNAACSAVTELVPGDKVKVTGETSNRGRITGNKMGFSGILIYPA